MYDRAFRFLIGLLTMYGLRAGFSCWYIEASHSTFGPLKNQYAEAVDTWAYPRDRVTASTRGTHRWRFWRASRSSRYIYLGRRRCCIGIWPFYSKIYIFFERILCSIPDPALRPEAGYCCSVIYFRGRERNAGQEEPAVFHVLLGPAATIKSTPRTDNRFVLDALDPSGQMGSWSVWSI